MRRYFLFFLLSMFVGYASEWGPYYISLFSGANLELIGYLQQYEEPCNDPEIGAISCKTSYRIPQKIIQTNTKAEAIGLGVILHTAQIYCDGQREPVVRFGEIQNAGKTLDGLNLYGTFNLRDLKCSSDLLVKVWSPTAYRRYGHIGAPAVIGSAYEVERVKKFVEFFRSQLLMVLAALFLGVYLFNQVIFRILKLKIPLTPIERYFGAWLGFMFFFSGIASTLFPLNSASFFFTRLSNFFIILANFGLTVYGIGRSKFVPGSVAKFARVVTEPHPSFGNLEWLHVVVMAFVLTPGFAKGLGPVYLGISSITFLFGFIERSPLHGFFGLLGVLCGLKLLMAPYMPEGYAVMVFALACITHAFAVRVKKSAHMSETTRWSRDLVDSSRDSKTVAELLQSFADRFGIRQITLVMAQSKGGCEISVHRFRSGKWNNETFFRNLLPPMISHVLTTRQPLWHVEQDSLLALNIRKGQPSSHNYSCPFFTVIPLVTDSCVVGAVSFTDYGESLCRDEFENLELTSAANHLFSFIAHAAANRSANVSEDWDQRCISVAEKIAAFKNVAKDSSLEAHLTSIACLIASELQVGVFIGRLDPLSRKIQLSTIAGYDEEAKRSYQSTQFYAVSHNEQGPLALAINRGQIVTVGDVGLITSVLHSISLKVFSIAGTKSCAAVPISIDSSGSENDGSAIAKDSWGVIWLESADIGRFSPRSEAGLRMIQSSLETLLLHVQVMAATSRAKLALAGFVPDHVLTRILRGEPVREEEDGYLLMADLLDSTRLSRQIGAERWYEFVSSLVPAVREIAQAYGYTLQVVVWDAFFFTRGCQRPRYSEVVNTLEFSEELNALFAKAMTGIFNEPGTDISRVKARFCLTYGDVTRDAKLAFTDHWTIVGSSMAAVHKLEQACKGASGWFYISETGVTDDPGPAWTELDLQVKATGERVFKYERSPRPVAVRAERLALIEIKSNERKPAA